MLMDIYQLLFYRKLQHKNLVELLGVILHNGLYIITEFMAKVRHVPAAACSLILDRTTDIKFLCQLETMTQANNIFKA